MPAEFKCRLIVIATLASGLLGIATVSQGQMDLDGTVVMSHRGPQDLFDFIERGSDTLHPFHQREPYGLTANSSGIEIDQAYTDEGYTRAIRRVAERRQPVLLADGLLQTNQELRTKTFNYGFPDLIDCRSCWTPDQLRTLEQGFYFRDIIKLMDLGYEPVVNHNFIELPRGAIVMKHFDAPIPDAGLAPTPPPAPPAGAIVPLGPNASSSAGLPGSDGSVLGNNQSSRSSATGRNLVDSLALTEPSRSRLGNRVLVRRSELLLDSSALVPDNSRPVLKLEHPVEPFTFSRPKVEEPPLATEQPSKAHQLKVAGDDLMTPVDSHTHGATDASQIAEPTVRSGGAVNPPDFIVAAPDAARPGRIRIIHLTRRQRMRLALMDFQDGYHRLSRSVPVQRLRSSVGGSLRGGAAGGGRMLRGIGAGLVVQYGASEGLEAMTGMDDDTANMVVMPLSEAVGMIAFDLALPTIGTTTSTAAAASTATVATTVVAGTLGGLAVVTEGTRRSADQYSLKLAYDSSSREMGTSMTIHLMRRNAHLRDIGEISQEEMMRRNKALGDSARKEGERTVKEAQWIGKRYSNGFTACFSNIVDGLIYRTGLGED